MKRLLCFCLLLIVMIPSIAQKDPKQSQLPANPPTGSRTYISIDASAFSPRKDMEKAVRQISYGGVFMEGGATWGIIAPVNLPHRATITSVTAVTYDINAESSIMVCLTKSGNNVSDYISCTTSGGVNGLENLRNETLAHKVIDNATCSYYVTAVLTGANTAWSDDSVRLLRVIIEYIPVDHLP